MRGLAFLALAASLAAASATAEDRRCLGDICVGEDFTALTVTLDRVTTEEMDAWAGPLDRGSVDFSAVLPGADGETIERIKSGLYTVPPAEDPLKGAYSVFVGPELLPVLGGHRAVLPERQVPRRILVTVRSRNPRSRCARPPRRRDGHRGDRGGGIERTYKVLAESVQGRVLKARLERLFPVGKEDGVFAVLGDQWSSEKINLWIYDDRFFEHGAENWAEIRDRSARLAAHPDCEAWIPLE